MPLARLVGTTSANRGARAAFIRRPFLAPARQLDVELAAREQHILQRFADIVGFDCRAAIARMIAFAIRSISS
jgi:hypothetical protein